MEFDLLNHSSFLSFYENLFFIFLIFGLMISVFCDLSPLNFGFPHRALYLGYKLIFYII